MVIIIFLKRKIKEETTKKQLFHWQLLAEQLHGQQKETEPLKNIRDSCSEDKSFTADVPDLQRTKEGGFCIPCSIKVQSDISTDNGTELIIEIYPDSLVKFCTSTVLQVTSVSNGTDEEIEPNGHANELRDEKVTPAKPDGHEREEEELTNQNSAENEDPNAKRTVAKPAEVADTSPTASVETGDQTCQPLLTSQDPQLPKDTSQCESMEGGDETCQPLLTSQDSQIPTAPTISDVSNPFVVRNGETDCLEWDVTIPTGVPMEIIIFLKRKIKEESVKKQLFHWQLLAEQLHGPKKVTEPLKNIRNSGTEDKSFTADVPELQRAKEGVLYISRRIEVQPDISTDNGTELIIEIYPDSLEKVCTSTVLQVTSEDTPTKPDEHERKEDKSTDQNSVENEDAVLKQE
ncbi:uncharacterized protein LOC134354206 [Mobula hypostoma]|uniref:uncharacterized protein LOC134354206 n=1 Tax=Mobula hypostoma TaxID=723540 RepID=UPI002FC2F5E7